MLIFDVVKMHQNMLCPRVSIIHSKVYFHILKKVTQDECFDIKIILRELKNVSGHIKLPGGPHEAFGPVVAQVCF